MRHDIFISYRREGGEHLAGRIKDALKSRGFSVFMDVEDLKSGKFNLALFSKIEEVTDFIVILTPGCLDRCANEDDWLRLEIRHAIQCKKNIVPVIARGFEMLPAKALPTDIAELVEYNGPTPAHELFDASIDRLVSTFLKSKPLVTPDPKPGKLLGASLHVRDSTDTDYTLKNVYIAYPDSFGPSREMSGIRVKQGVSEFTLPWSKFEKMTFTAIKRMKKVDQKEKEIYAYKVDVKLSEGNTTSVELVDDWNMAYMGGGGTGLLFGETAMGVVKIRFCDIKTIECLCE